MKYLISPPPPSKNIFNRINTPAKTPLFLFFALLLISISGCKKKPVEPVKAEAIVSTFAGSGAAASTDGKGISASISGPYGLVISNSSDLYVSEDGTGNIRKIMPDGTVSTLCTNAADAGLTIAGANYIIGANVGHTIKKITLTGDVLAFAGTGSIGSMDGPGASATFYKPRAVAYDAVTGRIYVADAHNNKIRLIEQDGTVKTFAGSGFCNSGP